MNAKQKVANGISLFKAETDNFSQVQAAWRFYNNENVTTKALQEPILEDALSAIRSEKSAYVLCATDWSHIDYKHHHAKKDKIKRDSARGSFALGYDLQSSLAISAVTGAPIAPLVQNLKTAKKVYSTYSDSLSLKATHLEELTGRALWMNEHLGITKRIVHIVDREADSVELYRAFQKNEISFLIRTKTSSNVYCPKLEKTLKIGELAEQVAIGIKIKSIKYNKKMVDVYANEIDIIIERDGIKTTKQKDGTTKQTKIPGDKVPLRLIVERLMAHDNSVVAEWLILSNLPKEVKAETIGLWYYYRWNIESYFKLLKTAGFALEQWQQEESSALFRRLLVVSLACVLVWKLARSTTQGAQDLQRFLVNISGRLVEKKKVFTAPALLAGLWTFLTIIETISVHSYEDLLRMKEELQDILGIRL